MSESMTTGEIEDVLASIRRLVSEDAADRARAPTAVERLVLTPALRVAQSEMPQPAPHEADPDPGEADEAADDEALERSVAELEAAVGESAAHAGETDEDNAPAAQAGTPEDAEAEGDDADAWEPVDLDGYGTAAGSSEDHPEAEVVLFTHSGTRGAPSAIERERNVAAPDLESLLDEAELKALVAEVLREELKGPLGERITRNVRKLVRREIAQALSSLELE